MERTKLKITHTACDPTFATRVSNSLMDLGIGVSNCKYVVFPGFCDVHVHFREPGFSYKETIATGCAAAARGGYTAVCTMPNLNPAPDT
jgi:dihydroorotase